MSSTRLPAWAATRAAALPAGPAPTTITSYAGPLTPGLHGAAAACAAARARPLPLGGHLAGLRWPRSCRSVAGGSRRDGCGGGSRPARRAGRGAAAPPARLVAGWAGEPPRGRGGRAGGPPEERAPLRFPVLD